MPLRALEFYSGIGGMHYALIAAVPEAEVLRAFEINDVANDVYEHNFGKRPKQARALSYRTGHSRDNGAALLGI